MSPKGLSGYGYELSGFFVYQCFSCYFSSLYSRGYSSNSYVYTLLQRAHVYDGAFRARFGPNSPFVDRLGRSKDQFRVGGPIFLLGPSLLRCYF